MKHIGTKEARDQLHALLNTLQRTKEPITIEKNNEPIATILEAEEYQKILKIISLLNIITNDLPSLREKPTSSRISDLYGSVKSTKPNLDWKEAEQTAKEEHFGKRNKNL